MSNNINKIFLITIIITNGTIHSATGRVHRRWNDLKGLIATRWYKTKDILKAKKEEVASIPSSDEQRSERPLEEIVKLENEQYKQSDLEIRTSFKERKEQLLSLLQLILNDTLRALQILDKRMTVYEQRIDEQNRLYHTIEQRLQNQETFNDQQHLIKEFLSWQDKFNALKEDFKDLITQLTKSISNMNLNDTLDNDAQQLLNEYAIEPLSIVSGLIDSIGNDCIARRDQLLTILTKQSNEKIIEGIVNL